MLVHLLSVCPPVFYCYLFEQFFLQMNPPTSQEGVGSAQAETEEGHQGQKSQQSSAASAQDKNTQVTMVTIFVP